MINTDRPIVMGILNITPDSFSDGGSFLEPQRALSHAMKMVEEGADLIDIGGESTRPNATPVSIAEECRRILPVIELIQQHSDIPISVDTRHVEVMRHALERGVYMINDMNALQSEGAIELLAQSGAKLCLYHCQSTSQTMQINSIYPIYQNVIKTVYDFLNQRIEACLLGGIAKENIVIDPGFGFSKTADHNINLLASLDIFKSLKCTILVGLSRKSMFERLLNLKIEDRLYASISAAVIAYLKGARIIRVHDVKPTVDALKVADMVLKNKESITAYD